jgi:thiamine biosynthesis lipoprotein
VIRIFILLFLPLSLPLQAEWRSAVWDSMGTRATLEFWHPGSESEAIIASVKQEFVRLQGLLSPWIEDSELARFNALDAGITMNISSEFHQLLRRSAYYAEISGGAFDITFAGAGHLYDYRAGIAPDDVRLQQTRIGMHYLRIANDPSVAKVDQSVRIDLGGIAKGYAIDRAVALLRQAGIEHAYISLGGDSYVMGQRNDRLWQVGIRHPRHEDAVAITLPLTDIAVSTSGDYERFFVRDGEHVHHILNPKTGKPAGELSSVTVLAAAGVDADALSTTLFVLGIEKGMALANQLAGVSAVMIDLHGKVYYSDDLGSVD